MQIIISYVSLSLSLSLFLSLSLSHSLSLSPVSVHGRRNRSLGHEHHVPPCQVGRRLSLPASPNGAAMGGWLVTWLRYRKGGAHSAYGSAVCEKEFMDFFLHNVNLFCFYICKNMWNGTVLLLGTQWRTHRWGACAERLLRRHFAIGNYVLHRKSFFTGGERVQRGCWGDISQPISLWGNQ
jgi:hypothetical protein